MSAMLDFDNMYKFETYVNGFLDLVNLMGL